MPSPSRSTSSTGTSRRTDRGGAWTSGLPARSTRRSVPPRIPRYRACQDGLSRRSQRTRRTKSVVVIVVVVVMVRPASCKRPCENQRIHPREQLVAERLDAIGGIRRPLLNPLEPLLLLREPAIDALEPLEDLRAHLLQPQHAVVACDERASTKPAEGSRQASRNLQQLSAASGGFSIRKRDRRTRARRDRQCAPR